MHEKFKTKKEVVALSTFVKNGSQNRNAHTLSSGVSFGSTNWMRPKIQTEPRLVYSHPYDFLPSSKKGRILPQELLGR